MVSVKSTHSMAIHVEVLGLLADLIASALQCGTALLLNGDLGVGKTTLARYVIRSIVGDDDIEVASPTFSIMQLYESNTGDAVHCDFYRLADPDEVEETGFRELIDRGYAIIEWPDRAEGLIPPDFLSVSIGLTEHPEVRQFTVHGAGRLRNAAERIGEIWSFFEAVGWSNSRASCLHGDASSRRYFSLRRNGATALLMDMPARTDGPRVYCGRSYGEVAHLAENVVPFVAISDALRDVGISTPKIYASDVTLGLLIIEDLGDLVFGKLAIGPMEQQELWKAGTDVLLHLQGCHPPERLSAQGGVQYELNFYDRECLYIEIGLLLEWYWPAVMGRPCPDDVRLEFEQVWDSLFSRLSSLPVGWVLRDFHSPNLLWIPGRVGIAQVGVIDFQDAVIGHSAYDLVSLLQDARVDVNPEIEQRLKSYYCEVASEREPAFNKEAFLFAYSLLGAQRNTKILGIFTRLAIRDRKPQYLNHIPRIWKYIERNLEHPSLASLAVWYGRHFPKQFRI